MDKWLVKCALLALVISSGPFSAASWPSKGDTCERTLLQRVVHEARQLLQRLTPSEAQVSSAQDVNLQQGDSSQTVSANYEEYLPTRKQVLPYEISDLPENRLPPRAQDGGVIASEMRLLITDQIRTGRYGGGLREIRVQPNVPYKGRLNFFAGYTEQTAELFGEEGAKFLQFTRPSSDLALDPDASELNNALDQANSFAESNFEKTFVRFYEPTRLDRVSDFEYMAAFGFFGMHPKSYNSNERTHDSHFHLGAILMPEDYVQLLRAQARMLVYAIQFYRNTRHLNWQNRRFFKIDIETFGSLAATSVVSIDVATGIIALKLNKKFPQDQIGGHAREDALGVTVYNAMSYGFSPRKIFREYILGYETDPEVLKALETFETWMASQDPDFDFHLFGDHAARDMAFQEIGDVLEKRLEAIKRVLSRAMRSLEE